MQKHIQILLINPEDIDKFKRISESTPYAGLAFLAAYAEFLYGSNVNVEIIEMLPQRMTIEDVVASIKKSGIDVCGITAKTYNFPFAAKLAAAIKAATPRTIVTFGGAHATALPNAVVSLPFVDAVVHHEGEIAFGKIIGNLRCDRHPFEGVRGVFYKSPSGDIIDNGPFEMIDNLDELPTPDWGRYYNLNLYDRRYDKITGRMQQLIPVFASRGCPYSCQFCQSVLTRKYRTRSAANVVKEIEHLAERYHLEYIYFEDSIFGMSNTWFAEFCRLFQESYLYKHIAWGFETNVNNVDADKMRMAFDAGCVYVYFGIESASDTVLEHLGKNSSKEKIVRAIDLSKNAGIQMVAGSFIFGLPFETSKTAAETLEFMRSSKLDSMNINLLDIYPGTELYEMVDKRIGGIRWMPGRKDQWDQCGRTLVKTFVNDLNTEEKLQAIHSQAVTILNKKIRANRFSYFRSILTSLLYYSFRNPRKVIIYIKLRIRLFIHKLTKLIS